MRLGWSQFIEENRLFLSLWQFALSSYVLFHLSNSGGWVNLVCFITLFCFAISSSYAQAREKEHRARVANSRGMTELAWAYQRELDRFNNELDRITEKPIKIDNSLYISDKRLLRKLDEWQHQTKEAE